MKRKTRIVTTSSAKRKKPCCETLTRNKAEIESYIAQLIDAQDDFGKTKWAWGVIRALEPLSKGTTLKRKKSFLCKECESYITSRKRLAELVILGSKG